MSGRRNEGRGGSVLAPVALYIWLRFVVPAAILTLGIWWLLTDVLGVVG